MASAVSARRYAIACACLLAAAGALRFYNLSGHALRYDEVFVADISRGSLSDVVELTRYTHHIPALWPIALWGVQKAMMSGVGAWMPPEAGARLGSAAASVLTVWALVYVMPRLGVSRRAAFMAGLLAALSAAAIEHAQDAREYSVDALVAVALIAGLLQYLRSGGKALLCVALIVGPLLQYGLVLFGAAVIATAAIAPGGSSQAVGGLVASGLGWRWRSAAVWERLRERVGLLLPLACFGVACAASWWLTAGYQLEYDRGRNLTWAAYYYQGGLDARAVLEFAVRRTWGMLSYHMPPVVAGAALVVWGCMAALRRGLGALGLLGLFGVGAAICAALADAYPYGGIRYTLCLGPIIFLTAGMAFDSAAGEIGRIARRAWVVPALAAAALAAIAVAGAAAVWQRHDFLYYSDASMRRALAAVGEFYQEGDAVYVSRWEVPFVEFYKWRNPDGYFYGNVSCWGHYTTWGECVPEMLDEMFGALGGARRIWLIHNTSVSAADAMGAYAPGVEVEEIGGDWRLSSGIDERELARLNPLYNSWNVPQTTLHLITGHGELAAQVRGDRLALWDAAAAGEPSAAGAYDLYLRDDALYYGKEPCAPGDAAARFFLHLYPLDVNDLPDRRRERGFDNLDFEFREYGLVAGGRCVIRRDLPGYAVDRVHTGQFVGDDVVWEAEIWVER